MQRTATAVTALVAPDTAFVGDRILDVSRLALVFLIVVASLAAGVIEAWARPAALGQDLYLARELDQLDALLLNMPPRQYERARAQAMADARLAFGPAASALRVVGRPLTWVALFYEVWLLLGILVQFAGGEELPVAGHRRLKSQYVVLVAFLPLVAGELAEALTLFGDGGDVYATIATYEEYQAISSASVSFASAFGLAPDSRILAFLVDAALNPFVWWCLFVFVLAAQSVFRLSIRSGVVVAIAVLAILSLQAGAISAARQLIL